MSGKELNNLPVGVSRFGGTEFDVRGILELASTTAPASSATATNIAAGMQLSKFHVLMGVGWNVAAGKEIGAFVLHHAGGRFESWPTQYGVHVKE